MFETTSQRIVEFRKRPDLVAREYSLGSLRRWRVKDPVSLEYFELSDQEFAILEMLDGSATWAEIQSRFARAFAPLQLGLVQLQNYLYDLYESGLVLAGAPGQGVTGEGARVLERRLQRTHREITSSLFNLLAFRFRGFDPQKLLDWLHARLEWLFAGWFLTACSVLVFAAAMLAVVQFDVIRARVPALGDFLTAGNVIWLVVVLAAAKGLHELAHGLTCRHFGGECHELGLMFLVFTPCLYCNVSDSWMLPSRRQRILIAAAGVLAELVLAALCTFLWWFSQPGLFNSICLDVMLACSVSTLAFNANPLLRYDGYFILADLLHESNLSQKSTALVRRAVSDWFYGIPWSDRAWRTADRPALLALYAVLAAAYRLFVLATILWLVYAFCKARGVPSLGGAFVMLALGGAFAGPAGTVWSFFTDPLAWRRLDRRRMNRLMAALAILLLLVAFVPLPRRIRADVMFDAPQAAHVYVPVAGRLLESIPAGTRVTRGTILARLANPQLQRDIEKTTGQRDQAERYLASLETSRAEDPTASAEIPAARETLQSLERRLVQQQRDEARLVLQSPTDGIVLPPPYRSQREVQRPALAGWNGTPLDAINAGCWLEMGTLFCQVGDPAAVAPQLLIGQSDVDLVRPGQRVRLCVNEWPSAVLTGTIAEVAANNLQVLPRGLTTEGDLAARRNAAGALRPVEATYSARVTLDAHAQPLLLRGRGTSLVTTSPAPLATRLYRALRQTFHFRL